MGNSLNDIGLLNIPKSGYKRSGDLVNLIEFDSYVLLFVIDVTGHGDNANVVSNNIFKFICDSATADLKNLTVMLHDFIKGTVGSAIGLLLLNIKTNEFEYCGVGNTSAIRCVGDNWTGISRDGVLGIRLPSYRSDKGTFTNGDIFVMFSDGVSGHLVKNFVKSKKNYSAENIAEEIIKNLAKSSDDASCIVVKWLQ